MANVKELIVKNKAIIIFALSLFFFVLVKPDVNVDIHFMIKHGEYIMNNGFTNIEPFTVHEGLNFSFEKWLGCVIAYMVYKNFGWFGLNVLTYLLLALTGFIIFKLSKYMGGEDLFLPAIVSALYIGTWLHKRPQLVSNILILIEFYYLEKFIREDDKKMCVILPIISWLYMSIHSTMMPVFWLVMLPFFFDKSIITRDIKVDINIQKNKIILLCIVAVVSFLTTLLNPYGIKSYEYMINSYSGKIYLLGIGELLPLNIKLSQLWNILITFIILYILALKNNDKLPVRHLAVYIVFGIFALYAVRNLQYFVILCGIILCGRVKIKYSNFLILVLSFYLCVVGVAYANAYSYNLYNYMNITEEQKQPFELMLDSLEDEGASIFTENDLGAYALRNNYRVYIDARAEVYDEKVNKKKDIITEFRHIQLGILRLDDILKMYDFDYFCVYKETALDAELRKRDDWFLIAETKTISLFSKNKRGNFISVGNYVSHVVDKDLFDTEGFQNTIDAELSCASDYLHSGARLIADHDYQLFNNTITNDTLLLWDSEGNIHEYEKIDMKKGIQGSWETDDGFNVYTDYKAELVTQVCSGKDTLTWCFWNEVDK